MHRKDNRLTEAQRTGKSGRQRAMNRPPENEPFVWLTSSMLESTAWRSLSKSALHVLTRLMLEQMAHAGTENGNLICTHTDIAAYGVRKSSIAQAVRELEYFGLLRVTKGKAYKGHREPSVYRLAWLPANGEPATNEWRSITEEHAKAFVAQRKNRLQAKADRKRTKEQSPPDNLTSAERSENIYRGIKAIAQNAEISFDDDDDFLSGKVVSIRGAGA